jgi:hypothetical protein
VLWSIVLRKVYICPKAASYSNVSSRSRQFCFKNAAIFCIAESTFSLIIVVYLLTFFLLHQKTIGIILWRNKINYLQYLCRHFIKLRNNLLNDFIKQLLAIFFMYTIAESIQTLYIHSFRKLV